jgi:hypothetical protein
MSQSTGIVRTAVDDRADLDDLYVRHTPAALRLAALIMATRTWPRTSRTMRSCARSAGSGTSASPRRSRPTCGARS